MAQLVPVDDTGIDRILHADRACTSSGGRPAIAARSITSFSCGGRLGLQRVVVDESVAAIPPRPANEGTLFRDLVVDRDGSARFKRTNRWIATPEHLPYTVICRWGEMVDGFAASRVEYLEERIAEDLPDAVPPS